MEKWKKKAVAGERSAMRRKQARQIACCATKAMLTDNKKMEDLNQEQECAMDSMDRCVQRNKVRREWKKVQDMLIKNMSTKIRTWHFDGTEASKEDLYQMMEAASTALKAQYYELSGGVDIETAAQRKAEKAITDLGKLADREAKLFAGSAAAEEYIKQDGDYRR